MKKIAFLAFVLMIFISCQTDKNKETTKDTNSYLLEKIPTDYTGITFKNTITEDAKHSIINYIYYYNGSGVAVGDIDNDGLPDLYFASNMNKNRLYINKGNFTFEDISEIANINSKSSWNTGVSMVDINNDDLLDIYVCSVSGLLDFTGHNELFINNGDGTFTEKAKEYGLDFKGYSTQAYFFDYDKDDDLDVYIVNHAVHTTLSHGPASMRDERKPLVGDVLLKNENGKFIDASEEAKIFGGANGYGLSASIADFNNDGWDDIYVCNDFHEDDYYYINNQDGTFKEELNSAFSTISRFTMGSDAADLNADGLQDLITLDMLPKDEKIIKETEGDDAMFNMQSHLRNLGYKDQYSRNMLQINNDNGAYFHETALINNIEDTDWSWGPLIADFNNDGHQDIFIANGILRRPNGLDFRKYVASAFKSRSQQDGLEWLFNSINEMPRGDVTNEIFEGNSKIFKSRTGKWIQNSPSLSNGAVYVDLDRDGDLDIVTNNLNNYPEIYKNNCDKANNSISIDVNYRNNNKEGIGTKALIYYNNKSQIKQLFKARGFLSSTNSQLHFGLGQNSSIDSLVIIWPDTKVQVINNPKINTIHHINYAPNKKNSHLVYVKQDNNKNIFSRLDAIDFIHKEDNYNDFFSDKLIPYKVSTLGPAVSIADIDKNGFDDVLIGNASGREAILYLNNGTSFVKKNNPALKADKYCEDNDAVFFDADNDGDLDLYIATGINEIRAKNFEIDRLYINTNNTFKKVNQIPENTLNASSVVAYDYDNDGDVDLFIGNLSNPDKFGANVESFILKNDGNGNFSKDPNFMLQSKVRDAVWSDINNDGIKDLLVATEWDTPKVYINSNGTLALTSLPNISGLWQTISTYDYDSDGDQDILLGNWGLNTRFNASKDKPLRMYFADFDLNNDKEAIISYNVNGKYYPLNSRDELAAQMNVINKRFVLHSDYSLKTMEEVLTPEAVKNSEIFEVNTLASGILKNNNGTFNEFISFDDKLQLAPIKTFSKIEIEGLTYILIGGNSLSLTTYHGSYTSLKGYAFNTLDNVISLTSLGIEPFCNQIKSIEAVKTKNNSYLLVVSNNDVLKSYLFK